MHHFDANRVTPMTQPVVDAMVQWCNRSEREVRKMLEAFREEVATECSFEKEQYAVVFTSGASEANTCVVVGAVRAFAARTGRMPHVVVSAAEHESLLGCCRALENDKMCLYTVLPVEQVGPEKAPEKGAEASERIGLGCVSADALKAALRPNTCLVSIVAAHADTGVLSNLRALAAVARAAKVPFHTDAAQLFGRTALRPVVHGLDAFSASFHKFGGPPGVGALVVSRALLEGYSFAPFVCGAEYSGQNEGLRGGLENAPGLGASLSAFRHAMKGRAKKNARLALLRDAVWAGLASRLPCFYAEEHPADQPPSIDGGITPPPARAHRGTAEAQRALASAKKARTPVLFWVAPRDRHLVLPNTLLLAVRLHGFSAREAQAALEKQGVVVGLPTAGVGLALGLPAALRENLLRVSFCDGATGDDAKELVRALYEFLTGSTTASSSSKKRSHYHTS
jgi:cysteine sulfinate desulfinase/cysteine desulfurase-like protein